MLPVPLTDYSPHLPEIEEDILKAKLEKVRTQLVCERQAADVRAENAQSEIAKVMKEHDIALNQLASSMENVSSDWQKLYEVSLRDEFIYLQAQREDLEKTLFCFSKFQKKIRKVHSDKLNTNVRFAIKVKDKLVTLCEQDNSFSVFENPHDASNISKADLGLDPEYSLCFVDSVTNCGDERIMFTQPSRKVEAGKEKPNETVFYDIESKTWTQGPSLNKLRERSAACYLNKKVYVIGGYEDDGE